MNATRDSRTEWLCLTPRKWWYGRPKNEVLSGSKVSTHPTTSVQKTKRFFSQIKKIENFTFAKITKFTTFSKEKLSCSKVHLTSKDNRERFSTTKNWIFRLQLPKTGIFDFCKNSKYRKMVKNYFYRSLRKVESFLFFLQFSKYFAPTSSRIYLMTGFSTHLTATDIFEVRLLKIGMFNRQEIFSKNQNFKNLLL